MAKVIKNFYHKGKWYFPGDAIEGPALTAARKVGCVPPEIKATLSKTKKAAQTT